MRRTILFCAMALAACTTEDQPKPSAAPMNPDPTQNTYASQLGVALPAFFKTPKGVYYQDLKPGTGIASIPGRKANVRYTGWLPNGKQFDAGTYAFTPGAHEVIEGWDEGVVGMKVGGKRKLVIPGALAYGANGAPPDIPPNAVLVFDVELLSVE